MKKLIWGLVLGLSVAVLVCAQDPQKAENGTAKAQTQAAAALPGDYKIGPQDVLKIDVWKEPDISRTIPVRPDGKISLPLLNDVQAAGLTAMELAGSIREALTKYITSPQVTVTVAEINSRRVYVMGEVLKPGPQVFLPNMTALQALAGAGGFTQFAKIKGIYVRRPEGTKQTKLPFNYKTVLAGKEDDIPLQPGDVIVVP